MCWRERERGQGRRGKGKSRASRGARGSRATCSWRPVRGVRTPGEFRWGTFSDKGRRTAGSDLVRRVHVVMNRECLSPGFRRRRRTGRVLARGRADGSKAGSEERTTTHWPARRRAGNGQVARGGKRRATLSSAVATGLAGSTSPARALYCPRTANDAMFLSPASAPGSTRHLQNRGLGVFLRLGKALLLLSSSSRRLVPCACCQRQFHSSRPANYHAQSRLPRCRGRLTPGSRRRSLVRCIRASCRQPSPARRLADCPKVSSLSRAHLVPVVLCSRESSLLRPAPSPASALVLAIRSSTCGSPCGYRRDVDEKER